MCKDLSSDSSIVKYQVPVSGAGVTDIQCLHYTRCSECSEVTGSFNIKSSQNVQAIQEVYISPHFLFAKYHFPQLLFNKYQQDTNMQSSKIPYEGHTRYEILHLISRYNAA